MGKLLHIPTCIHAFTLLLYVTIFALHKMLLQKYTVSGFLRFLPVSAGTMATVSDVPSFPLVVVVFHFSGYFEIRIMFHQNI